MAGRGGGRVGGARTRRASGDDAATAQTLAGRARDELTYSAALVLCCGRTEEEFVRRAAAIGREPEELRANGAAGTVDEVTAKIASFAEIGARRIYLQVLDLTDIDHLELVAEQVMPALP